MGNDLVCFTFSNSYGVSFFKTFALVMNALDNRAARNHVNRMCLAADVPLIESGTAGYAGQVNNIYLFVCMTQLKCISVLEH